MSVAPAGEKSDSNAWPRGFYDCFGDCGTSLYSCCCYPCAAGKNASTVEKSACGGCVGQASPPKAKSDGVTDTAASAGLPAHVMHSAELLHTSTSARTYSRILQPGAAGSRMRVLRLGLHVTLSVLLLRDCPGGEDACILHREGHALRSDTGEVQGPTDCRSG